MELFLPAGDQLVSPFSPKSSPSDQKSPETVEFKRYYDSDSDSSDETMEVKSREIRSQQQKSSAPVIQEDRSPRVTTYAQREVIEPLINILANMPGLMNLLEK